MEITGESFSIIENIFNIRLPIPSASVINRSTLADFIVDEIEETSKGLQGHISPKEWQLVRYLER